MQMNVSTQSVDSRIIDLSQVRQIIIGKGKDKGRLKGRKDST